MNAAFAKNIGFVNLRNMHQCIEQQEDFKKDMELWQQKIKTTTSDIIKECEKEIKNKYSELILTYRFSELSIIKNNTKICKELPPIPIQLKSMKNTKAEYIKELSHNEVLDGEEILTPYTKNKLAKLHVAEQEKSINYELEFYRLVALLKKIKHMNTDPEIDKLLVDF